MKPHGTNPSAPFPRQPVPADLLEWARQAFDKAEFLAQFRDIEATGGLPLDDFLPEVEARVRGR